MDDTDSQMLMELIDSGQFAVDLEMSCAEIVEDDGE
jgi:hypothetical protein